VSERAYLSIGEVLQLLQDEFPDVTISKIRFLESQGLIDPERTPSGYRKFYDADIERLKFILREQKDSYLPLKVIKHRLDAGEGTGPVIRPFMVAVGVVADEAHEADATNGAGIDAVVEAAAPRLPLEAVDDGPDPHQVGPPEREQQGSAEAEDVALAPPSSLTFDELVGASSLTAAQLREVERYGLVVGRPVGGTAYYDEEALVIARLVGGFLRFGIEPRHVRMYRNAAEREAGVFEQVILPLVKQRNPQARVQALASLAELTQLGSGLRDAMMRQALRGYTDSL
jgi:DNA-binding transcriptional MerR regulator